MSFLEGFLVGAVSVIILDAYLQQRGDDLSPFEQVMRVYREVRIDDAEFEPRPQFHLHDRTPRSGGGPSGRDRWRRQAKGDCG